MTALELADLFRKCAANGRYQRTVWAYSSESSPSGLVTLRFEDLKEAAETLEHQHKENERLRAIEKRAKSNLAFIRDAADQRLRAENDWNMSNVFRFAKRAVEEMESAGKAGEAESG